MPRVTIEYDMDDIVPPPEGEEWQPVRVEVQARGALFTALHDAAEGAILQVLEGIEAKVGLDPGSIH